MAMTRTETAALGGVALLHLALFAWLSFAMPEPADPDRPPMAVEIIAEPAAVSTAPRVATTPSARLSVCSVVPVSRKAVLVVPSVRMSRATPAGSWAETRARGLAKYRGAPQLVIDGGDHAFRDFGAHLPAVFDFCGFAD